MGGAQFSIHSIWSAARYRIPVVFVCFVNREYRSLKEHQGPSSLLIEREA
jgi:benzoylformate decarboxylase